MGLRSRNLKPGFFKNEVLGELPPLTRLLFEGLWLAADREGRLEDRPVRIKAELFPYDALDVNGELTVLEQSGFIRRYTAHGLRLIQVVKFKEHQSPHHTERASVLPGWEERDQTGTPPLIHREATVSSPLDHGGNPPDSLIPDSLIPDSSKNPLVAPEPVVRICAQKKSKPSSKPSASDDAGHDPRHVAVRSLIQELHLKTFRVKCEWDGSEAKALNRLLESNPSWTVEQLSQMVGNRFSSDQVKSSRPRAWLSRLGDYAGGPLDRFEKLKQPARVNGQQHPVDYTRGAIPVGDGTYRF
jgi:hypothetical protein